MEDDRDGDELVEVWQAQNRAWSFEGESGLRKLEKLLRVLGYGSDGYRYGSTIETFLADNPGAVTAIVDFVAEWTSRNEEWRAALSETVGQIEET